MTQTQPLMFAVARGVDLPLGWRPAAQIDACAPVRRVALLGRDYPGIKPALLVQEGDRVTLGQPLFSDRNNPRLLFTSPACGRVWAINRGERRVFQSLVIELDGDDESRFPVIGKADLPGLRSDAIEQLLLDSGLWTALRTRPFSRIPAPGSRPEAIFVTAMDTNPLAADPSLVIAEQREPFLAGLQALRPLTAGRVYLCHSPGIEIPCGEGITTATFSGPHPAGLPGTHIHFLHPVDSLHRVWHLGYQDLIAIGKLLLTGRLDPTRIVSLGGLGVHNPRLLRTRLGADLTDLTAGELREGDNRVISGSVLSGYGTVPEASFLGRYHNGISVLPEGRDRKFLQWLMPGFTSHSITHLFASSFIPRRDLPFSTSFNGSLRAMVPIGAYEKVMPLDLKITWLLRSLLAGDRDMAKNLGCLELDEEDLALCSYVCPGKIDYGYHLRQMLNRIEEEGE